MMQRMKGKMMDRLFLFDSNYIAATVFTPSVEEYQHALNHIAPRSLDKIEIIDWHDSSALPVSPYIERDGTEYKVIPVGGIPYVRDCLLSIKRNGFPVRDAGMTPIEIPEVLIPFTRREYRNASGTELLSMDCIDAKEWFIKDVNELKHWSSNLQMGDLRRFVEAERRYSISRKIAIASEWRIFVYDNEVLGSREYTGEPLAFPDATVINDMVNAYSAVEHPRAYTLDIAVVEEKDRWNGNIEVQLTDDIPQEIFGATVPLEVHPFICCGLYGFYDNHLADMLECGWNWYLGT